MAHDLAYIEVELDSHNGDTTTAHCTGCELTVRTVHGHHLGQRPVDAVWVEAEESLANAHGAE